MARRSSTTRMREDAGSSGASSVDGGGEPERLEMAGDYSRQPAIAPAGDRLAFERASQGLSIYKLRARGEPEPVLVSTAWDYNPQFSPDGLRIAFSSVRSGDLEEIWLASADGSGAQQLTHGPGTRQTLPAWSPDGRHIAFESTGANGRADIWVIPADGGVPRQVTTDPGEENAPAWSRDGKRIYFLSDRNGAGQRGGRDTWQVPSEGGPSTRVTVGGSSPVVFESLDGKALIYQSRVVYESPDGTSHPDVRRRATPGRSHWRRDTASGRALRKIPELGCRQHWRVLQSLRQPAGSG